MPVPAETTPLPRAAALAATLVAAAITAAVASAANAPIPNAPLDALLDRALAANATPGIAVAAVQGDRVVWLATRGWADREAQRPVAPDTRFYIASTTKAFTATAAACLSARGQLDLDAPLTRALPKARFHAAVHPESIRVVDLLTHTHGIDPEGPVSIRVAYTGDYTYDALFRALATHGAARGGRAFEYSNLGYDLAGIVLDPKRKGGWKEVVEREVMQPLGMSSTTAYRSRLKDAEIAMPYENSVEGFERVPLAKQDENMGPAGGMFSTAPDLARFVLAELNAGRVDGRQALPASVVAETQRAHALNSGPPRGYRRFAWGLGWDLGTYAGDTLVHRFGSFPGYGCHVSFIPSRRVGVVVLVNNSRTGLGIADVIANAAYDELLAREGAETRIQAEVDTLGSRMEELRQAIAADRARRAARSQQLPRPLAAYAGRYVNPDWGTLELVVEGGRLAASMGVARCPVEVFDAAKERLRIELFGRGGVVDVVFPEGATRAAAVRLAGAEYRRE